MAYFFRFFLPILLLNASFALAQNRALLSFTPIEGVTDFELCNGTFFSHGDKFICGRKGYYELSRTGALLVSDPNPLATEKDEYGQVPEIKPLGIGPNGEYAFIISTGTTLGGIPIPGDVLISRRLPGGGYESLTSGDGDRFIFPAVIGAFGNIITTRTPAERARSIIGPATIENIYPTSSSLLSYQIVSANNPTIPTADIRISHLLQTNDGTLYGIRGKESLVVIKDGVATDYPLGTDRYSYIADMKIAKDGFFWIVGGDKKEDGADCYTVMSPSFKNSTTCIPGFFGAVGATGLEITSSGEAWIERGGGQDNLRISKSGRFTRQFQARVIGRPGLRNLFFYAYSPQEDGSVYSFCSLKGGANFGICHHPQGLKPVTAKGTVTRDKRKRQINVTLKRNRLKDGSDRLVNYQALNVLIFESVGPTLQEDAVLLRKYQVGMKRPEWTQSFPLPKASPGKILFSCIDCSTLDSFEALKANSKAIRTK